MELVAAAAVGGAIVLGAAGWGWCAARLVDRAKVSRGVPGAMRLVVDNVPPKPVSAAQDALGRLEALVAAHRDRLTAADGQGAIRSPRQS